MVMSSHGGETAPLPASRDVVVEGSVAFKPLGFHEKHASMTPRPNGKSGNSVGALSLVTVFLLYAVQGVPFGFIDNFLPLMMYDGGASLSQISLVGVMGMPWMLKWLWAPLVDAFGIASVGRRKTWILPAHFVMLVSCGLCATVPAPSSLGGGLSGAMVATLLLWATATAVEDCAVDGFAMSLTEHAAAQAEGRASTRFLAVANFAQVVGFKAGHVYSGAPLWAVYKRYGWGVEMWAFLALPIAVVAALAAATPEPPSENVSVGLRRVIHETRVLLGRRQTCHLMVLAASYKVGEKVLLSMFKPALVDEGYSALDVGSWAGTYGTIFSILGSSIASACMPFFGTISLALRRALVVRACLFALSLLPHLPAQVAIAAQGFGSGCITPIMFAFLMEAVSGSACSVTNYTVLQCCDDLSRCFGQTAAGWVATYAGFRTTFILSIAGSLAPLGLLVQGCGARLLQEK